MATLPTAPESVPIQSSIPYSASVRTWKNVGAVDAWISIGLGAGGILYGVLRRSPVSLAVAGVGGYLVAKGLRRKDPLYSALRVSTATRGGATSVVERAVLINRAANDIYYFWHDLPNLPRVAPQLISVTVTAPGRSHWIAKAPFGNTVEWDAEMTEDEAGRLLAWRSLPGSQVSNAGTVRFTELPYNRGTEVRVRLEYQPPAGPFGAGLAFLADEEPHEQVAAALRRLKQLLEAGEIATVEGQSAGQRSLLMNTLHALQRVAR